MFHDVPSCAMRQYANAIEAFAPDALAIDSQAKCHMRGGMPPRPISAAIGDAIAQARREAGISSQCALARATGYSPVEINKYERGKRMPTLTTLARLTAAGLDPVPILAACDAHQTEIRPCPTP